MRRHNPLSPETRVVAALRGGPTPWRGHLLRALDRAGSVASSAWPTSTINCARTVTDDEAFCVRVAASLNRRFVVDRDDVRAVARRERRSIEDAAQVARHEFFERARVQLGADVVALGHTQDDQAETFLLRLVRGAGARSLARCTRGTEISSGRFSSARAQTCGILHAHDVASVHDETNDDVGVPRNRVRAELLPFLGTGSTLGLSTSWRRGRARAGRRGVPMWPRSLTEVGLLRASNVTENPFVTSCDSFETADDLSVAVKGYRSGGVLHRRQMRRVRESAG